MNKNLSIGKILNFHGIKGEVKIGYTQGRESLLTESKFLNVSNNSIDKNLTVENVRFHKNFAIIKFKEINSIDDVLAIKGCFIKVPKEKLVEILEEDEFLVIDLIGVEAYDTEGNKIGIVKDVFDIRGEDILAIIDENNNEHLVPFVKELVPNVSLKEKKLVVKEINGLLE